MSKLPERLTGCAQALDKPVVDETVREYALWLAATADDERRTREGKHDA